MVVVSIIIGRQTQTDELIDTKKHPQTAVGRKAVAERQAAELAVVLSLLLDIS